MFKVAGTLVAEERFFRMGQRRSVPRSALVFELDRRPSTHARRVLKNRKIFFFFFSRNAFTGPTAPRGSPDARGARAGPYGFVMTAAEPRRRGDGLGEQRSSTFVAAPARRAGMPRRVGRRARRPECERWPEIGIMQARPVLLGTQRVVVAITGPRSPSFDGRRQACSGAIRMGRPTTGRRFGLLLPLS